MFWTENDKYRPNIIVAIGYFLSFKFSRNINWNWKTHFQRKIVFFISYIIYILVQILLDRFSSHPSPPLLTQYIISIELLCPSSSKNMCSIYYIIFILYIVCVYNILNNILHSRQTIMKQNLKIFYILYYGHTKIFTNNKQK